MPPAIMLPSSSLATWPPTNTNPPALVATERGRVRVPGLRSAKYSIVIWGATANNHASLLRRRRYTVRSSGPVHLNPLVAALGLFNGGRSSTLSRYTHRLEAAIQIDLSDYHS